METCLFKVTNDAVFGRTLMELKFANMTGAIISRMKSDDKITIPMGITVLHENDWVQCVGTKEALAQAEVLLGGPKSRPFSGKP